MKSIHRHWPAGGLLAAPLIATLQALLLTGCSASAPHASIPEIAAMDPSIRYDDWAVKTAAADDGFSAGFRGTWKHESVLDDTRFDYARDPQHRFVAYRNPAYWADAHAHGSADDPEEFVQRLDEFLNYRPQVRYVVLLSGSLVRPEILRDAAEIANRNGTRMVVFARLPNNQTPDLDALQRVVEDYGVRGIKLHTSNFITRNHHPRNFNTPEWNALYAKAGELGIPILWHVTQRMYMREAMFENTDFTNEDILAEFEDILRNHRDTNFIGAHKLFLGPRRLGELFDEHPNLYVDTSVGGIQHYGDWFTDEEQRDLRNFYIRYQDRFLYGTDNVVGRWRGDPPNLMRVERTSDKTHQRYFIALNLPQEVLEKIAHGNLERLAGIDP